MIIDFRTRLPIKIQFPGADYKNLSFLPDYMSQYVRLFSSAIKQNLEVEDLLSAMESNGIDKCVLQAEWEFGNYKALNEGVSKLVAGYPEKFIGFCTVHPENSKDMAKEVEEWVLNGNMKGVNLQPWAYKLHAHDRKFYPLYEKCLELNIPVTVHTGINYSSTRSLDFGRPLYLDIIACDFPDLKIIANHGGWPWVNELVAIALKHPTVYIETGAVSPKYIGKPGTGWETFIEYGNSILKNQILFASEWPLLPFDRLISEINGLPFAAEVKEKYLYHNAARLLKLK